MIVVRVLCAVAGALVSGLLAHWMVSAPPRFDVAFALMIFVVGFTASTTAAARRSSRRRRPAG